VGGGGLIAGIGVFVKYLRPDIRIIGVEPEDTPSRHEALRQNKRVRLDQVGLFADGVAVDQVGREPFRLAKDCVDEVVLVSTDEICAAIRDIYEDTRAIAEPAGGLAVAGIKAYAAKHTLSGQALLGVIGGANMNFDRLGYVAERTELGEHREALLAVSIAEEPGSFRRFCHDVSEREITEFNYRYEHPEQAHVFAGIHLQEGLAERDQLIAELRAKGYPVLDMTDNELAKMHIRHMVGGHAPHIPDEMLFRVEFPQRIGALQRFLNRLGQRWNITLFHYRNHGADYARVMVGMQVPPEQQSQARALLQGLGYPCLEETTNPAYRLFLGGAADATAAQPQPPAVPVALGSTQG
jgi:threonine dehydratase